MRTSHILRIGIDLIKHMSKYFRVPADRRTRAKSLEEPLIIRH